MKRKRAFSEPLPVMAVAALLACLLSCSAIDEDLSNCKADVDLDYGLTLKTNLKAEIQTELTTRLETSLSAILYDSLQSIFREYAHDVDLSFYINNERRYHMQHIMNAGEASYTLELPADDYLHLAIANIQEEQEVSFQQDETATGAYLHQVNRADTIKSHQTGLFTARSQMDVKGNINQTFGVKLYMANSAAILAIRTDSVKYKRMWAYYTGLGDGFYVKDSTYTYQPNQVVSAERLENPPKERECFYAVTFPSLDTAEQAKAVRAGRTGKTRDDGPVAQENSIWEMHFYALMPDDHIVETKLFIDKPLQAGQVMIIYSVLQPNGEVYSPNVEVGTSVNFDWKPGMHF